MEHEVRFYLHVIRASISGEGDAERGIAKPEKAFEPAKLIIAKNIGNKEPEVEIISENFLEYIDGILEGYTENMVSKTDEKTSIINLMLI